MTTHPFSYPSQNVGIIFLLSYPHPILFDYLQNTSRTWPILTISTLNSLIQSTVILTQTSAILPVSILAPLQCIHKE